VVERVKLCCSAGSPRGRIRRLRPRDAKSIATSARVRMVAATYHGALAAVHRSRGAIMCCS